MGMYTKGSTSRGMLVMALAMALGNIKAPSGELGVSQSEYGYAMLYGIRNHYRRLSGSRTSGAAAAKRASRKRRNIAKHNRSAHN